MFKLSYKLSYVVSFPKKTPVTRYNSVLSVTVSIVSMSCDVVSSNHSCATCVSEKPTGNSLKIDQINWNLFGLAKMESHLLDCPSDDDDVVICLNDFNDFDKHSIFQDSGATKKAPLDDLSKEELLSKCKNLLKLAQHAKSAKDGRCL